MVCRLSGLRLKAPAVPDRSGMAYPICMDEQLSPLQKPQTPKLVSSSCPRAMLLTTGVDIEASSSSTKATRKTNDSGVAGFNMAPAGLAAHKRGREL